VSWARQELLVHAYCALCGLPILFGRAMDWSKYGGLWTPCAGSVTPWQTHFGSEEYEPDARAWCVYLSICVVNGCKHTTCISLHQVPVRCQVCVAVPPLTEQ
jgi:hypothetical protein